MCNTTSNSLDPQFSSPPIQARSRPAPHPRPQFMFPPIYQLPFLLLSRSMMSTSIASVTNKLESANNLSNGKET
jgi:hypothetical protein